METILVNCPLFKGLDNNQIKEILEQCPHKVRQFDEKDFVILQNDVCNHLMIIVQGSVQAQMVDSFGKLIVIEELEVPQLLAPAFLFSSKNVMPVSLFTLSDTSILYFKRSVLIDMMQGNQNILFNFMQMISDRAKFLSDRLKFHAFKSIKNKIAFYLIDQHEKQNTSQIIIHHTQQELADRFGVTRPSLARSLADLEKEGLIEVKHKQVLIKNIQGLKDLM